MKNLFIITSAINSRQSAIDIETRYVDTFQTIESIRKKDPNAIIVLFDSSPDKLSDDRIKAITDKVDYFLLLSDNPQVKHLGSIFQKSSAESVSLRLTVEYVKSLNLPITRIFKVTGRGYLSDDFDISYYENPELKGKYVFKNRIVSWMSPDVRLLSTRCWSFSYELLPEVLVLLEKTAIGCLETGRDLEHVIYEHIDKSELVEKPIIGYNCRISLNGNLECD